MLGKPHTVCNCFSIDYNHELTCVSKNLSFILIVQTYTLSWESLINSYVMSTRDVSGLKSDA